MQSTQKYAEVERIFALEGNVQECTALTNGHINETYRLTCRCGKKEKRYILQKINRGVFLHPKEVMENIEGITGYLQKKIAEDGGDPRRETLTIVPARDGSSFYLDEAGEVWRVFLYIEQAVCYDEVRNKEDFYACARGFGAFQRQLADYPAETLHETIPDFHNTQKRYENFERSVRENKAGRADTVQEEIAFVRAHESLAASLLAMRQEGKLPLRVTHNDTKLNNLMFDEKTKEALCVIDLDTVMPGLSACDFGDAIRYGASTAAEDEPDLSKVSCSMELFGLYTKGYLEACGSSLTKEEIDTLPLGAETMTYECGMRFLTDYLEGDHYFRIDRKRQNLDRARTQFALVRDMEQKEEKMRKIVEKNRRILQEI